MLSLRSSVVQVRDVAAGTPVGYGGEWIAARPSALAAVAIGFADGYPRALASSGFVIVRGRRAPIVSHICPSTLTRNKPKNSDMAAPQTRARDRPKDDMPIVTPLTANSNPETLKSAGRKRAGSTRPCSSSCKPIHEVPK